MPFPRVLSHILVSAGLMFPALVAQAATLPAACSAPLQPQRIVGTESPTIRLDWGSGTWLTVLLLRDGQLAGHSLAEPLAGDRGHRLMPGFAPLQDGETRYRVLLVGESQDCDAGEIVVAPAQRFPGLARMLVDIQLNELGLLARLHDGDADSLRRPLPDSSPPVLQVLGALARMVDGEDNPQSVRARLERLEQDGGVEAQQMQAQFEMALMSSGLLERQSERIGMLGAVLAKRGRLDDDTDTALSELLDLLVPVARAMSVDGDIYAQALQPDSAEGLARMMGQQLDAEIRSKPGIGIYRDMSGMVAQIGFTGINALSAGRAQRLQQAGNAYNGMLMVWSQIDKLIAGLFPGELLRLDVDAVPTELRDPGGSMQGAIERAEVVARSKGVDLGKLALGLLLQSQQWVPLKPVAGAAGNLLRAGSRTASERAIATLQRHGVEIDAAAVSAAITALREQVGSRIPANTALAAGDAASESASGATRWAADNLGLGMEAIPDLVKIAPSEFAPVSVLQPGFYQARSSDPRIVSLEALSGGRLPYIGLSEGSVALHVETMPGAFPNAQVKTAVTVSVERNAALLQPPIAALVPGAWTVFTLSAGELSPADFEMRLSNPAARILGQRELSASTDARGRTQRNYEIRVQAPADPKDFPVSLEAYSTGEGRRLAASSIVHPRLVPERDCIAPGARVEFDVDPPLNADPIGAAGMRRDLLRLRLEGSGTLHDWIYTAPTDQRADPALLILSTREGKELDRQTLEVGCRCRWKASLGGQVLQGRIAQLTDYSSAQGDMQVMFLSDTERPDIGFVLLRDETLAAGGSIRFRTVCNTESPFTTDYESGGAGLGTHDGQFIHVAGVDGFMSCPEDYPDGREAPPPSPLLLIRHLDETWVEGRLDGEFMSLRLGQTRPTLSPVSLEFRARRSRLDMSALSALAGSGIQAQLGSAGPQSGLAMAQLLGAVGVGNHCVVDDEDEPGW